MKRPMGVVLSAVVLALVSLFQVLMAAGVALGGVLVQSQIRSGAAAATPMPVGFPVILCASCVFFLALAAWGILTVVGLFRMRRWARYSALVIGGGLALIGLFSALAMLMMMVVPLPVPAGADPSQTQSVQAMTKVVFGGMALFYGLVFALGVSWLVYFSLKSVREAFSAATGEVVESRRPFLISLLAVLNLFGAASCLFMVFLPFPGTFFGWMLYGWQKGLLCLVYGAVAAAIGVGLWQLREWGRRLALGLMAFGLVHSFVYLVRPGLMLRYMAEINQQMVPAQSQLPQQFQTMMYDASFGFSILYLAGVTWVLIHYRKAFQPPADAEAAELTPIE